jgi:ribonuclease Z
LSGVFAVHELLHEGATASVGCEEKELHANEAVGLDIPVDSDGVWRSVLGEGAGPNKKGWAVQAGPIEHRGRLHRVLAGLTNSTSDRIHSE